MLLRRGRENNIQSFEIFEGSEYNILENNVCKDILRTYFYL